MDEYTTKHDRLMQLMEQHNVDAIHLAKSANVAWASGGKRVYIDIASEEGIASLLITRDRRYLLTNNIEAERLRTEEGFADWDIVAEPWYEQETQLQQLTKGMRLAADSATANAVDVGDNLIELRAPLTPPEVERYRALGHDAGAALGQVARQITPGMTEDDVAARIAAASYAVGAVPVVVLVVADERMDTIRHPLPTGKRIDRRTMMVLCALRNGLIANLTRIVHFGPVPAETQRRMEAVTRIEATAIAASRPGAHIGDIFARIQGAYADTGFADEWRNHHQGGACSYGSRDYIATPDCDELVRAPQAFAWNPSVPGAKSEDTVLVSDGGFEVLTPSPDWPMLRIEIDGIEIERPTILEL